MVLLTVLQWILLDPIRLAGGLCCAWKLHLTVSLMKYCSFFIHVNVFYQSKQASWDIILIYASCIHSLRDEQFSFLLNYKSSISDSCLFMGNFNCVLWSWEKEGGGDFPSNQALVFKNFISSFGLLDLGFCSPKATLNNCRFGDANIWERLDRSLASYNWISLYQHANLSHLDDLGSNHRPFLLNLYPSTSKAKRFFWFDSRWTSKSEAFAIISEAWNANGTASSLFNVFSKLKACRHALVS